MSAELPAVPLVSEVPKPFPPVPNRIGWRAAGIDLTRRTTHGRVQAATTLGPVPELRDEESCEVMTGLADVCARELRTGRPDPDRSTALANLALELLILGDELSERTMVARARRLAECERGLVRLQDFNTTAGLIDGVCDELIRSLGFERTMLARVEGGMWRPWKANASMRDEAWVSEWIERAIPLDELTLETRLLRERRPALVSDTHAAGIAQMVHAAGVSSYVVAPIMPAGQVVGFFHADHGIGGRACDVNDRDILWTFAEGFGHLYERTALLEQLNTRREQVRTAIAGVNQVVDEITDSKLELTSDVEGATLTGARPSVVRRGISNRLRVLTPRELEVLELLVAGARNGEISERLVVTVGTVKTHVANIFAKLGVVNRSQVISLYLGLDSDAPEQGSEEVRPLHPTR